MHIAGIVHRDVKPANIILVQRPPQPHACLVDLGLARSVDGSLDSLRTEAGAVLGSLSYTAPETILGQPATPASDIWSLGITGFELLTGAPPFKASSRAGLASVIVNSEAPIPPAGPEVQALFQRMLEKEPQRRCGDARKLADELHHLAGRAG